jgi:hypothetical protein
MGVSVDFSNLKQTFVSISTRIVTKMDFSFVYVDELPQAVQDSLWEQGVSLDDTDYMLITYNINLFHNIENETLEEAQRVLPEDYNIERLINRADDNRWYRVKIVGKDAVVGIAYH